MGNNLYFVIPIKDQVDSDYENNLKFSMKNQWVNNTIFVNNTNGNSIFKKYNYALNKLKLQGLTDSDIICFTHSDVKILDPSFEEKIKLLFSFKTNLGIVGVIGTRLFERTGGWWTTDRNIYTRGHIIQGLPDKTEFHMCEKGGWGGFYDVVTVDGCMFFMSGKMANQYNFDDRTFSDYHFYDVDTCFTALEMGFNVMVADILIKHQSEGPLSEKWFNDLNNLIKKWEDKGYLFPLTLSSFKK